MRLHEQGAVPATQAQARCGGRFHARRDLRAERRLQGRSPRFRRRQRWPGGASRAAVLRRHQRQAGHDPTRARRSIPTSSTSTTAGPSTRGWQRRFAAGRAWRDLSRPGGLQHRRALQRLPRHARTSAATRRPVFFNTGTADPPKCGSDLPLLTLQNKTTGETKRHLRSGPRAVHRPLGGHRKVPRAAAAWSGLSRALLPRRAGRDDQRRHPALPGSLQPGSDDPADQRSGRVPERALRPLARHRSTGGSGAAAAASASGLGCELGERPSDASSASGLGCKPSRSRSRTRSGASSSSRPCLPRSPRRSRSRAWCPSRPLRGSSR